MSTNCMYPCLNGENPRISGLTLVARHFARVLSQVWLGDTLLARTIRDNVPSFVASASSPSQWYIGHGN